MPYTVLFSEQITNYSLNYRDRSHRDSGYESTLCSENRTGCHLLTLSLVGWHSPFRIEFLDHVAR